MLRDKGDNLFRQSQFFAELDPVGNVTGNDFCALHRPQVIGGVLAEDCAALLGDFFADRRAH